MAQSTEVLVRESTLWADIFGCVDSKTCCEKFFFFAALAVLFYFSQRLDFVACMRRVRTMATETTKQLFRANFGSTQTNMDSLPRLSTQLNPGDSPEALSAACYDSAEDEEASRHQVLWENTMAEGRYQNLSLYDNVEVLLLCWAISDMDTTTEVQELRDVFVKDFGYHTTTEYLNADSKQKLQVQVNARVAKFVGDHDGPNTLLLVYYAGHGGPGQFFGDLELAAHTSPNDHRDANHRERNRLVWNKTEDLLRPAEADVLEIFDWYADLDRHRLFEYLAAAKDQGLTQFPGATSFTSALIFALKRLVRDKEKGRFTTDELLRKIKTAPKFPKDQTPVMSNRDNKKTSAGRIMLHPLRKYRLSRVATSEECQIRRVTDYLMTLHFHFGDKPPDDHIITLGRNLNKIFERNTLEVHGVRWGGMKATLVTRATRKFQMNLMKRRASSQSQRPTIMLPPSTPSSEPLNSSLLSPNGVTFDSHDSGGDESCSPLASSAPTTPLEANPKAPTEDQLVLGDVVGRSSLEELLKASLPEGERT
ncbi:MAG: hypothetical protein Q9198_004249 [Flavoplaca austrocitrina]